MQQRYEVVVVGAGPVGLSTALFLADRGVRVLVVDKRDPMNAPPRASTSVRTLELFRSIGLESALAEAGWDGPGPLRSVIKDSAVGAVQHTAVPPARYADWLERCSPLGIRRALTQYEIQRIALEALRRRGGDVRFDAELTGFDADASGVHLTMADSATGREEELACAYLVGADGARSRVRQLLGIDMPSRHVAARLNTAFFRADLGRLLPESTTHSCFIRNEHVYCTLFAKGANGDRWSSHIMDYPGKPAGLTKLSSEQTIRLLHAAVGDDSVPIELIECNAWEAAIGMASAFGKGRVFLAGDAAHTQSSAGGLGMNTGIQDGHNLAWKLAAVLRGHAGEALLDSYESERRAAAEASLALSERMHHGYQAHQDTSQLYTQLAADYLRGMMCYQYSSGAIVGDDQPGADVLTEYAVPGRRLPHRWLTVGDRQLSTLDLVGAGWTLLTGPRGDAWHAMGIAGLQVRKVTAEHTGSDPDVFTDMAGIDPDGALLVRPDHFIAWRSPAVSSSSEQTLRQVTATLLGLS
ncbi:FAD-dependent oxidoreductase [Nocardia beijingensis]|uniref:FAD-dependent oxidoreductase n=1 Tax=Nocardia beijingensis TaxID=95162 RepID=UPI0018963906|nr:FAD-dependent oxidoreductase [Nocardia beijingensis]MBF6468277.1 FAD-dependent oxidoreductase [Nocardia beijingensis]